MTVTYIGTAVSPQEQWGPQEHRLVKNIQDQISSRFKDESNLLINLTWFGPQFGNNNSIYNNVIKLIKDKVQFDNLFWMASTEPIFLLPAQITEIEKNLQVKQAYYIGGFEQSEFAFNFSSTITAEDFIRYSQDQILLTEVDNYYLCYNRKPKPHRIELVEKIYSNKLEQFGIVTLGKNDVDYDVSQGLKTDLYLTVEENALDYSYNNRFLVHNNFGGIPYDLLSLGRLDIWQTHFLNIVCESEFFPWDNMFVTEKTWKPILGLRPFILNGQTKIYRYLRDNGFRTFTHWFDGIELEDIPEHQIHDSIVSVIKFLTRLSKQQIKQMYTDMLPDLKHNEQRFWEFAKEQQHKINNVFG